MAPYRMRLRHQRGVFGYLTKPFDAQALLAEVEARSRSASPRG